MVLASRLPGVWRVAQAIQAIAYRCGYCDFHVAADKGYYIESGPGPHQVSLRICPLCNQPTFLNLQEQFPGVLFGEAVKFLPAQVESLYTETRKAAAAGAHTAAVLTARKILMHVAVDQKADPGLSFVQYVEYLASMQSVSNFAVKNHVR